MTGVEVSDAHEQAQTALATSPIGVLRRLRVDRDGSTLILSGNVESFYQKQLAQELVRTVAREYEVVNAIRVQ